MAHLRRGGPAPSPGEVEEVDVARVEEGLGDPADVPHEIHLQNRKLVRRSFAQMNA